LIKQSRAEFLIDAKTVKPHGHASAALGLHIK
jgi:hypothetical protein